MCIMSQSWASLCCTRPVFFIRSPVTGCKIRNLDRRVGSRRTVPWIGLSAGYRCCDSACMIGLCTTMHIGTCGAQRPHTQIISSSAASRYQLHESSTMVVAISCLGKTHRHVWLEDYLMITQRKTGSGNSHKIGAGQPAYREASF